MRRLIAATYLLCATLAAAPIGADTLPPLTTEPGRVDAGLDVFVDRRSGHCVLCHRVAALDVPFQGDLGPDLSDVGRRLTSAQIRFRIVDASALNPETIMPPYYRTDGLVQVPRDLQNRTVLTREEIEHLVAYLASLERADP